MDTHIEETTALFRYSGGDARKLLNIIDLLYQSTPAGEPLTINDRTVTESLQLNPQAYDKNGEMHYDIISAFIKSIRGSDPDAAIYWLARMIAGGEDPEFIARRLVIVAAEDIGLANPNALLLANATFDTISKIGMPEGRIPLAECTIYLATSEKSNSAYMAINNALQEVERSGNLPVPLHIRNAPTSLMKKLGYGKNYKYAHDYPAISCDSSSCPTASKASASGSLAATHRKTNSTAASGNAGTDPTKPNNYRQQYQQKSIHAVYYLSLSYASS